MNYRDDAYRTTWQRMCNSPTANDFCTRGVSLEDREWLHDMPNRLADEHDDGLETWAAPEAGLLDDIREYDTELTLPRKPRQIGRGRVLEDPAAQERQRKYYADLAAKRAEQMAALRDAFQHEPSEAELRQLRTALADIEWDEASPALREAMRRAQFARGAPEAEPPPVVAPKARASQSARPRKLTAWEREWREEQADDKRMRRQAERDRKLFDPVEIAHRKRMAVIEAERATLEAARKHGADEAERRQIAKSEQRRAEREAQALREIENMRLRQTQELASRHLAVQQVGNQILQIMRCKSGLYTIENFMALTGYDRATVLEACERLVGQGYLRKRW